MGRCDVKRDPNAGAYLEAVKGTVCHIPGDYLSKAQSRQSYQETGRKSNFWDHSNRLVSKFFIFHVFLSLVSFQHHRYTASLFRGISPLTPAVRRCHRETQRGAEL